MSSPDAPLDQPAILAALRARMARLEGAGRAQHAAAAIPVCDGLPLPGGGLARAALHEVVASAPGCGAGFCAMLLARTGGTVLWILAGQEEVLSWPPGLARFGLDPARLILVRAARRADALWAMEEALRCPAVGGALLMPGPGAVGALDLTATRRLQLAAEAGGALGLLLRPEAAQAAPSAAVTRWRVGALGAEGHKPPSGGGVSRPPSGGGVSRPPSGGGVSRPPSGGGVSRPPSGGGLESPHWHLELLRARGGRPGGPWAVSWQAATGQLALAAMPSGQLAGSASGQLADSAPGQLAASAPGRMAASA